MTEEEKAAAELAAQEAAKAKLEEEAKQKEQESKEEKDESKKEEKSSLDDASAKLLKELMAFKEKNRELANKLKIYDGLDAEQARKALADAQERERKEMEAKGEYSRIIEQINADNAAKLKEMEEKLTALEQERDRVALENRDKDLVNKFANSQFVRDSLVISGEKVKVLFGSHFEYNDDGELIAYDKPKGASNRTPLVDNKGINLSFEAALAKIVQADSDWESLAKSNMRSGAGSKTDQGKKTIDNSNLSNVDRIALGLKSLKPTSLI